MRYFLGLNLLSLSTSQKDAFCAAMAVLASTSKVPQFKIFILEVLAQTSFVFPALDHSCFEIQHGDFLKLRCLIEIGDRI